ncbi:MAG: hypothetical protein CM1200mP1_01910 [Candidatus Neomarinimicrobiota bacterium]|nr:MAG: hypothetical protein CM1200mP1_01910 [Candidatus Neomarinimicrobiota bacterium]
MNYNFSLNPFNVENESYQAFIDINSNNYHDGNDYPSATEALLPTKVAFGGEIKINNIKIGLTMRFMNSIIYSSNLICGKIKEITIY